MFTTPVIFLTIIVFCVGIAIGSIIESFIKRRSPTPPPSPPETNKLAREGDIEVLSAWRSADNRVWLDMDGKRLDNKEALQPGQHQRLLNLVLELRPWLEPARIPAPGSADAPQTGRPTAPTPAAVLQPVQPPKAKTASAGEEKRPAPALESIIEQIDKVLQVKLAATVYKDRGIGLTEGPGGIVIINDGSKSYEGMDSIPDPEIKALIQQAVSDWEKGGK